MSYFKVGDPETLVECPYNKTHMIRNKRMQYHLIDCRKQHTGQEMKVCPYNAKHIHPKAEHAFHLVYCTDRELIDRDIIFSCAERQDCLPKGLTGNTSLPAYTLPASNAHMQTDEDWDSDACAAPFSLANINSLAFTQPRRTGTDTSAVRLPRDVPTTKQPTQSQSNTGPLGQSQEPVALANDLTAKQSKSCSALASLAQQQNSRSSALADVRLPRTKETVPAALSPPQPSAVSTGVTNGVGSGATQASVTPAVVPPRLPADAAATNDSIPSSIHLKLNLLPVGRGRGSMLSMVMPGSAVGRGSLSAPTALPHTRPGIVSQPGITAHTGPPGLSGPRLGGPSLTGLSGPSLTGLNGASLTGLVGLGRGQMILASRQQLSMQLTNSALTSTSAATTTTNTTTNTGATTTTTTTTTTAATTTTTNPIKQQVARQATVTPAFNLTAASVQSTLSITSGVGRGYAGHAAAPNARDLPLPVFGAVRGQTVRQ